MSPAVFFIEYVAGSTRKDQKELDSRYEWRNKLIYPDKINT